MALEVEARFRASDRATLERLASIAILGPATLGPATCATETDRYLDTHDGRLAAARWACRLRTRGDATWISLKGPPDAETSGWLHRRPELEGPASDTVDADSWPDSDARRLLLELADGRPLSEQLRLTQERTERDVRVDGDVVGTLSLDAVHAERGAESLGEFLIVELELRAEAEPHGDLRPLALALVAAEASLVPEPRTKLELALGVRLA
jgi:inorganic triphosphatase YgiF